MFVWGVGARPMAASAQVTLGIADGAATPLAVPDPTRHPQIGGIDRPRRDGGESLATLVDVDVTGCATGVVSTSNRSSGALQGGAQRDQGGQLDLVGLLVNNADTDADDISNPASLPAAASAARRSNLHRERRPSAASM